MRSRICILNICTKHDYSSISNKNHMVCHSSRKFVGRKKCIDSNLNGDILTLENDACLTENRLQSNFNKKGSSVLRENVSSVILNAKGLKYSNKIQKPLYNTPLIPDHFEKGFCDFLGINSKPQKNLNTEHKSQKEVSEKPEKQLGSTDKDDSAQINKDTRLNEINVQMLSKPLYDQIFKTVETQKPLSEEELNSIKKDLATYSINIKDAIRLPEVNVKIPPLVGKDIEEHFYNIAKEQTVSYLKIINTLIKEIPEIPKKWLLRAGWTRYTKDGAEAVDYPLEDGLIFDVEVCLKEGQLPTLATAVSTKAWYAWVSESVVEGVGRTFDSQIFTTDMLIPIESSPNEYGQKLKPHQKKPKIIVGHNVSFDRSYIKEQYWLNSTGTRFLDTMSMHICVSGINSYQRAVLKSAKTEDMRQEWFSSTSFNSLVEVHKLYCGTDIDKKYRNLFIDGTIADIKEKFHEVMNYCATDVLSTHNVLCKLFPIFQERFPHPVTLAGMLELSCTYLPVNSNWKRYVEETESTFEDLNYEAKLILAKRANEVCKLMHGEEYKKDLWMWDQDWSVQQIKIKKSISKSQLEAIKQQENTKKEPSDFEKYLTDGEDEEDPLKEEFSYLENTKYYLPKVMPHMPGYPAWYRGLCSKSDNSDIPISPQNISTSTQITPKLLQLTWENYPLHYIREHGWGILVPYNENPDVQTKIPIKELWAHCSKLNKESLESSDINYDMSLLRADVQADLHKTEFWRNRKTTNGNKKDSIPDTHYRGSAIWCNVDLDNCCYFYKLPHKNGAKYNVGNPLAKDFLNKFSENVLAGAGPSAAHLLKIARMVNYWRNSRNRVLSQFVIWLEEHCLSTSIKKAKKDMRYGVILPKVIVCGTLTRRAVETMWLTASNAHVERVGSELRSMVQAPPGYNIVGADVDSQELWIASLIGDSHFKKVHGATPFGWMTLIGNKSNGTDMHSVTAKAGGISRDHAKIINYARIYGAGQKFAERLLKQFNPTMTEAEAAAKARKMFALTKGKKVYKLKKEYLDTFEDKPYTAYDVYQLSKLYSKTFIEMTESCEWIGGSESAMFNRLEQIASSPKPITPFLNSRLTRALENNSNENCLPTKINWVVQSGAVDFLHLMLVSMRWLMRDYARFCLSFHDEVRYLVPSRYKYNAALAMHVTNLLTRSFCASRLGMKDLPLSVAFFAAVEVDTVLRKESAHDCKTPSNPHGLEKGYGIPQGESLDVHAAIDKSKGSFGWWHDNRVVRDMNKTKEERIVESSNEESSFMSDDI